MTNGSPLTNGNCSIHLRAQLTSKQLSARNREHRSVHCFSARRARCATIYGARGGGVPDLFGARTGPSWQLKAAMINGKDVSDALLDLASSGIAKLFQMQSEVRAIA